jgi:hypothetical protein
MNSRRMTHWPRYYSSRPNRVIQGEGDGAGPVDYRPVYGVFRLRDSVLCEPINQFLPSRIPLHSRTSDSCTRIRDPSDVRTNCFRGSTALLTLSPPYSP